MISIQNLLLIKSFLENRTKKVKVNDALSESREINVDDPQRSVLRPLLFIIYFNDFNYLELKRKNVYMLTIRPCHSTIGVASYAKICSRNTKIKI